MVALESSTLEKMPVLRSLVAGASEREKGRARKSIRTDFIHQGVKLGLCTERDDEDLRGGDDGGKGEDLGDG